LIAPCGGATNPLGVNQPSKVLKDAAVFKCGPLEILTS
jgi:hypothetical protein